MREIILDTETTGFDPLQGHRIVEIGCVEVFNYLPTGKHYHVYINPERSMPAEAAAVHGLKDEFLADKPIFADIIDGFRDFIGDAPLIIHNAAFDMNFINAEFVRLGYSKLPNDRAIDTVMMARRMFPGAPASLDALCKRFDIDSSHRELHGALLDAQLLADVYLHLRGGRQPDLAITQQADSAVTAAENRPRTFRQPRPHPVDEAETAAHEAFLSQLKDPVWKRG